MRTAIIHRVSRKYVDEEEIVSDISQKYLASTIFLSLSKTALHALQVTLSIQEIRARISYDKIKLKIFSSLS